jgi:hypothetical protein
LVASFVARVIEFFLNLREQPMALYAFDGTSNSDDGPEAEDTNVVRFREVYAGADFEYLAGVGTRLGAVGQVLGGLFGSGGRTRIEEMYDTLSENFTQGDQQIDIIGYSRGAALAVHFANKIAKQGINGTPNPSIRFLGLFDLVASFGLSYNNVLDFQKMNLFWDVETVPSNVLNCCHAMAMNERREAFDITRLRADSSNTKLTEMWFRGVHGDIGGGNGNIARSNIALQWMLAVAHQANAPINQVRAGEPRYNFDANQLAPISANKDLKVDRHRKIEAEDKLHPSVDVTMKVNDVRFCRVWAAEQFNWSGVTIEAGGSYEIAVPPGQTWEDGGITCGPQGWRTEDLPWYKEGFAKFFEDKRRANDVDCFTLMAALGDRDKHSQRVGQGTTLNPTETYDLYFYANDLKSRYGNNEGFIDVSIKRLS